MKKFCLMVIAAMITLPSLAQHKGKTSNNSVSEDSKVEYNILVQRLDSLEKKLLLDGLKYNLSSLIKDLQILKNTIDLSVHEIRINIINRNILKELPSLYKTNYELSIEKLSSYKEYYSLLEIDLNQQLSAETYSGTDMNELLAYKDVIGQAFSAIKPSLDLYKLYIEHYQKLL